MSTKGSRRRRGAENRERYREAFLDQAGAQILELYGLMHTADDETDASAAADLERLADTAGTLGFGQLERAARASARDLPLGRRIEAMRMVAQALRRTRGPRRLGPILVVAGSQTAEAIARDAETFTESIRVFPTMEDFTNAVHVDEPTAVCLPVEAHDAVRQLAEYENFPVLVHGPTTDTEGLALAMAAGAAGYLPRPIDPTELARQARWRSTAHHDLVEILLLMDPTPQRDQLKTAMEALGMRVVCSGAPADLGPAMDLGQPDAIVLGPEVNGVACGTLAGLVRGHGRCGHLPVMVCGKPRTLTGLRKAGIDDLMRDSAEPHHVAQRIRERIQRFQGLPFTSHLPTGITNRLGVLAELDAELRRARRDRQPLTVAMIQADGMSRTDPNEQRAVTMRVRQTFARAIDRSLRRTDVAGELLPGSYLFVLPRAVRGQAEPRLQALAQEVTETIVGEPLLAGIALRVGLADTELTLLGVASRAELDLS